MIQLGKTKDLGRKITNIEGKCVPTMKRPRTLAAYSTLLDKCSHPKTCQCRHIYPV